MSLFFVWVSLTLLLWGHFYVIFQVRAWLHTNRA